MLLPYFSLTPKPPLTLSSTITLSRRNHVNHATSSFPSLLFLYHNSKPRWSYHVFWFTARRGGRKVWANVKSEDEDVVVIKKSHDDLDNVDATTSAWWEVFPKRWAIVILCFSAFLLYWSWLYALLHLASYDSVKGSEERE